VAGTVEEYQVAYERFQKEGRPSILLYFHRVHQFPKLEQIDDLRRVAEFREAIDQQGLTAEYDTEDHLIELVRKHLAKTVLRFKSEKAESQARAANFLDEPRQDPGSEREVVDAPVDHRIDLLDLRLMLDAKLAWVSKHLLAGPDTPTFANVGSLAYDGYLPREQYVRLARLLAFDPGTVEAQEPEELASFARAVSQDVSNFRATVFDGYVRHVLRTEEWSVEDFEQSEDHRPDFIAAKDDRSFRVAPRLVTSRKSSIRDRAIKRLERTRDQPPVVTRRILVIPDISASPTSGPKTDPQIVKLCDLLSLLEP
jgi:hypothetical protein